MTFSYQQGCDAAFDDLGLQKEAGIRDALQVALTGRVPLRHGTSAARAARILETGLQPGASHGVSQAVDALRDATGHAVGPGLVQLQEGLAFLTRHPAEAQMYGRQQAALERAPDVRARAQNALARILQLKERVPATLAPAHDALEAAHAAGTRALSLVPDLGLTRFIQHTPEVADAARVLEARVPRVQLRSATSAHPEAGQLLTQRLNALDAAGDALPEPARTLARAAAPRRAGGPFMRNMVVRGGLPSSAFVGGAGYRAVPSLHELRTHAADALQHPLEYAKDVGRALTGISHRPANVPMHGVPAAVTPEAELLAQVDAMEKVEHALQPLADFKRKYFPG